jgi:clan AA aspartic protease
MGLVYADIELINVVDMEMAKKSIIDIEEIKRVSLNVLVDSGAYMMAINETIQSQLELPFVEKRKVQVADSRIVEYDVVGPVLVKFANRKATCNAFVLPGDSEPLLGAIPMEEMPARLPYMKIIEAGGDVLIHPQRQALIVNPEHPNYAVLKMK